MTKLELVLSGAALLALGANSACHSDGGGQSSSSSHWFTCQARSDCGEAPSAVACSEGYCVDDTGARIPRQSTTPRDAISEQSVQGDAASAALDAEAAPDAERPSGPTVDAGVAADASQELDAGLSDAAAPAGAVKRLRVSANLFAQNPKSILAAFNDAQGALLAVMQAGADGTLETDIAASSVTFEHLFDNGHGNLVTYFGVESGDNLLTFGKSPQFGPGPAPVYSATLPAPRRTGATTVVRGGCGNCVPSGSGSALQSISVFDPGHCLRDQQDNAFVAWVDGSTTWSDFEGFTWLKGLSKPLAPAVQSLAFSAYQPASRCRIRMSDTLPGFSERSGLIMWSGATCVGVPQLDDTHPYAPGFADDLEAIVNIEGHVLRRRAAPAATIEFDRAGLLPTPSAVQLSLLDNPRRIHVSWSMPESARLDAASLELRFMLRDWTIVLPPDVRSVTLPVLPRNFDIPDDELPQAKVYRLSYLASDSVESYEALRNAPPNYGSSMLDRSLTARGSSDLVSWTNTP